MSDKTCGYTVLDDDGIEEPCGKPTVGWIYYDGYECDPTLDRACAEHEQPALTEGIAQQQAIGAGRALREFSDLLLEEDDQHVDDQHVDGCTGQANCAACVVHDLRHHADLIAGGSDR